MTQKGAHSHWGNMSCKAASVCTTDSQGFRSRPELEQRKYYKCFELLAHQVINPPANWGIHVYKSSAFVFGGVLTPDIHSYCLLRSPVTGENAPERKGFKHLTPHCQQQLDLQLYFPSFQRDLSTAKHKYTSSCKSRGCSFTHAVREWIRQPRGRQQGPPSWKLSKWAYHGEGQTGFVPYKPYQQWAVCHSNDRDTWFLITHLKYFIIETWSLMTGLRLIFAVSLLVFTV